MDTYKNSNYNAEFSPDLRLSPCGPYHPGFRLGVDTFNGITDCVK
jgi:hypothetical protein